MRKFMGQNEAPRRSTPWFRFTDDDRHMIVVIRPHSPAGQAGNGIGKRDHEHLQTALFQKLGQIGNWIIAQIPGVAYLVCNLFGVSFVGQAHGLDGWISNVQCQVQEALRRSDIDRPDP